MDNLTIGRRNNKNTIKDNPFQYSFFEYFRQKDKIRIMAFY